MAMNQNQISLMAVAIFCAVLFIINTLRGFEKQEQQNSLMNRPISDLIEWKVPKIFDEKVKIEDEKEEDKDEEKHENDGEQTGKKMTRQELGRHGWSLLHMMGITYPEEADEEFVHKTNVFLNLFGQFYPCKECGGHFLAMIKDHPFMGRTRDDFMQHLCMLHNKVNVRLKKKTVDCAKELYQIWVPTCGCEDKDKESHQKSGIN